VRSQGLLSCKTGNYVIKVSKIYGELYIDHFNFGKIVRRGSYALLMVDKIPSRSSGKYGHPFSVSSIELIFGSILTTVRQMSLFDDSTLPIKKRVCTGSDQI
jgi:hypothetical protein